MYECGGYESLRRFEREWIPFVPFQKAMEAVESNLAQFRATGLISNLVITGESGAGKTSLCSWLADKHPRRSMPEADIVESLVVPVPATGTIGAIAESMLAQLGDPHFEAGTISGRTRRIVNLCRRCKVELVMFDEAHHVYDRGDARYQYRVGDWFKTLIDQIEAPCVLFGLPRLQSLMAGNEQLRRRFSRHMRLELPEGDEVLLLQLCMQLFDSLAQTLAVPVRPDPYDPGEFARRIYLATDGRVGYVKKLLMASMRRCFELDLPVIDATVLEAAYRDDIWWEAVGALNPFSELFAFRRLDRSGEPFERAHRGDRKLL